MYKAPSDNWFMEGGIDDPDADRVVPLDDDTKFFYQKRYFFLSEIFIF